MGLMDKFKNLFTDEEIIEEDDDEKVEIKEVKKEEEPKLPTFMREKIAKEEKKEETPQIMKVEQDVEVKKDIKLEKKLDDELPEKTVTEEKPTFKFPIDFNESDFTETRGSRQDLHAREKKFDDNIEPERKKYLNEDTSKEKVPSQINHLKKEPKVSELYKDKKEETKKQERKFRATPIISPIYGVIDKNYSPEDVENYKGQNFEDNRPSKSVDFDSVRKKAYGNLTEEIKENLMCENCEYLKEAKECKSKHKKTNTEEKNSIEENVPNYESYDGYSSNDYEKDITLDEATENYYDYGVEYEKQPPTYHEDHTNQNYYLDEDIQEDDVKIMNHADEEKPARKKEIPPVKSSINLLSTLKKSMGDEEEPKKAEKDLELTDDLFNLIDSMYDERNDNK